MTLEYFADGWEDGPVILLWGGGPEDVLALRGVLRALADGSADHVVVNDLPFIETPAALVLVAVATDFNEGVVRTSSDYFEWRRTRSSWDNIEGLVEPFTPISEKKGHRYQLLENLAFE